MKENPRPTGRGGPRKWWVRDLVRWEKVQEIRDLQESPHPTYGHLLPHGEGKVAKD